MECYSAINKLLIYREGKKYTYDGVDDPVMAKGILEII